VIPLPISDENPTERTPWVTYAIIGLNVLAWFYELSIGVGPATFRFGAIPSFVLHHATTGYIDVDGLARGTVQQVSPWPITVLTSMFMHGGWLHIIGNMWFLWIFGDNVEDAMGSVKYLIFYLLCGFVAAMAQVLSSPGSQVPMVGASGAIAGVLGAYIVLFPHARVRCLWILFILITTVYVPAWLLLGIWFVSQFFISSSEGVAWMAHVGGFVAGFLLVRLFVTRRPPPRRDSFPPLFERVPR
jgi:membrane associated rhomboid family serine protease